jgi:cholesterol oxidase
VVFSGGTLGTLRLLFHCRDVLRSLPAISPRLGDMVRTNNESLLGVSARDLKVDYSKGLAISSIFNPDGVTAVEPVRYPAGSSLIRFLSAPLIKDNGSIPHRILKAIWQTLTAPLDFLITHVLPGWARRTTILLVMQTEDNRLRMRLRRSLLTLGRRELDTQPDDEKPIPTVLPIGHALVQKFASKMGGIQVGSANESLLNIPVTAHILGGCPFGHDSTEGVIDLDCQVHHYPGLFVIDGSNVPGNPGVNPSLTITALAEYALSCIPPKSGAPVREPLGVNR